MYKIKIHSELESKAIQEHAFNLGARWGVDEYEYVQNENFPYLYITEQKIDCDSSDERFRTNSSRGISVDEFLKLDSLELESDIKFSDGPWKIGYDLGVVYDNSKNPFETPAIRADTQDEAFILSRYLRLHAAIWQLSKKNGKGHWHIDATSKRVDHHSIFSNLCNGFTTKKDAEKALNFLKDKGYL